MTFPNADIQTPTQGEEGFSLEADSNKHPSTTCLLMSKCVQPQALMENQQFA